MKGLNFDKAKPFVRVLGNNRVLGTRAHEGKEDCAMRKKVSLFFFIALLSSVICINAWSAPVSYMRMKALAVL